MASKDEESKKRALEGGEENAPAKEAKTEEPTEKEADAPQDRRARLKTAVEILPKDATLNLIPTTQGRLLMALSEGGMQYFVAGARTNVGIEKGRYLFEIRVVEAFSPTPMQMQNRQQQQLPKQQVRVGVSLAGSGLLLGEDDQSICFDADGFSVAEKKNKALGTSARFGRDQVIGLLVNMDESSPNANTVSLFRDGVRITEPQPLPETMRGKAVFPHVSFRNVSMQVNFGSEPLAKLPFACCMLDSAAEADVVVAGPHKAARKDGTYDVVFPVSLPDEGSFDWLDEFLEKNPHYVELSDRKIIEWATKSGLNMWRKQTLKDSNDKPDVSCGIPAVDNLSARKVLQTVAPLMPRNYVVMEVKKNLIKEERAELLRRFAVPRFRCVAKVLLGEPKAAYKARSHEELLKAKQVRVDQEWKAKKVRQEQRHIVKKKAKEAAEQRKAFEEAAKMADETAKKTAEEPSADAGEEVKKEDDAAGDVKMEDQEKKDETKEKAEKEEDKEEAKQDAAEEAKEEPEEEDEDLGDEPPTAELTEEDKQKWHKPSAISDLPATVLNTSFANFSVPEAEEGFSEISFEWQDAAKSKAYLKKWVLHKKATTRMEDLIPSDWFNTRNTEWHKSVQEWQKKLKEYKEKEAAKPKKQVAKPEADDKVVEGDDKKEDADEKAAPAEEDEKEKATPDDPELAAPDVFAVEDVCDIGDGKPLFSKFGFEDWTLASLRFELHNLVQGFKKDVNDPERPGVTEPHASFYYQKYFKKQMNMKIFGVSSLAELVVLVKDVVSLDETSSALESKLDDDADTPLDHYLKLTEQARRERQRRIDAGDETARIKIQVNAFSGNQWQPKDTFSTLGKGGSPNWGSGKGGGGKESCGGAKGGKPDGKCSKSDKWGGGGKWQSNQQSNTQSWGNQGGAGRWQSGGGYKAQQRGNW